MIVLELLHLKMEVTVSEPCNVTMVLLTIYNTHLNYGILTWEFNSDGILKKAFRSITLSKYNAHTEPIFKTLKLLKINGILNVKHLLGTTSRKIIEVCIPPK